MRAQDDVLTTEYGFTILVTAPKLERNYSLRDTPNIQENLRVRAHELRKLRLVLRG